MLANIVAVRLQRGALAKVYQKPLADWWAEKTPQTATYKRPIVCIKNQLINSTILR